MPACREAQRRAVAAEAIRQERAAVELAYAERRKWEREHRREGETMTAVWITGIIVFGLVGGFVALCYIAIKYGKK